MRKFFSNLSLIQLLMSLLLGSINFVQVWADDIPVTQVIFQESEPGVESYQSRLLLNDQYMRMDDGNDSSDFILFDLSSYEIHSFNHEFRTHIRMKPAPPKMIDFNMDFQVQNKTLNDAPPISGRKAIEYFYYADGQLCKKSVNVPGLLPAVTKALFAYEQAVELQNKYSIDRVPDTLKTSCYMANYIVHSTDYLKSGFPLYVSDNEGRERRLLDFGEVKKPASIFQLMEGYQEYSPQTFTEEN